MFNLGFSELILLGIIALIFIGPQQLPEVARSIGRLLNEFKRATNDFQETFTSPIKNEIQNRIQDVRAHLTVEDSNLSQEPVAASKGDNMDKPAEEDKKA